MNERETIHFTELLEAKPGDPFFDEWNFYLQQVGRLLADGHEGKFLLIKGRAILDIFDSEDDALREGNKQYLGQRFLVHQILEKEPLLRVRGFNLPWPKIPIKLAQIFSLEL